MRNLTNFEKAVLGVIKKIPRGKVVTYGKVAKVIGRPKAGRAVGNALHKNPHAPRVPCHRVVKRDGGLGGYAKGAKKKMQLLRQEGVIIKNNRVVDFENVVYRLE